MSKIRQVALVGGTPTQCNVLLPFLEADNHKKWININNSTGNKDHTSKLGIYLLYNVISITAKGIG